MTYVPACFCRVSKDEESISPLVSPSKRLRTPRTSGARRLEKLELEAKEAAATAANEEPADEVKVRRPLYQPVSTEWPRTSSRGRRGCRAARPGAYMSGISEGGLGPSC